MRHLRSRWRHSLHCLGVVGNLISHIDRWASYFARALPHTYKYTPIWDFLASILFCTRVLLTAVWTLQNALTLIVSHFISTVRMRNSSTIEMTAGMELRVCEKWVTRGISFASIDGARKCTSYDCLEYQVYCANSRALLHTYTKIDLINLIIVWLQSSATRVAPVFLVSRAPGNASIYILQSSRSVFFSMTTTNDKIIRRYHRVRLVREESSLRLLHRAYDSRASYNVVTPENANCSHPMVTGIDVVWREICAHTDQIDHQNGMTSLPVRPILCLSLSLSLPVDKKYAELIFEIVIVASEWIATHWRTREFTYTPR